MASAQADALQSGTRERGEVLAFLLRKGDAGLTVSRLRHAVPLLRENKGGDPTSSARRSRIPPLAAERYRVKPGVTHSFLRPLTAS